MLTAGFKDVTAHQLTSLCLLRPLSLWPKPGHPVLAHHVQLFDFQPRQTGLAGAAREPWHQQETELLTGLVRK